jgi:hypothetical protein
MKPKKQTVGSAFVEQASKEPTRVRVIDLVAANAEKVWEDTKSTAIDDAHLYNGATFYVVMIIRIEKAFLQSKIIHPVTGETEWTAPQTRTQIFSKATCPTPAYSQTVYQVDPDLNMKLIWTLPDKQSCEFILEIQHKMPENEHFLLDCVQKFSRGYLGRLCNELNGEVPGSVIGELIKKSDDAVGELKQIGKEWHVVQD